jgi:tetratricopeptide (TPR) repeat protein
MGQSAIYACHWQNRRNPPVTTRQQALEDKVEDAQEAVDEGRFDLALALCDDILRADRSLNGAWKTRTQALIGLERLDQAYDNAADAARLFPNAITHRLMQARIHVMARRWEQATAAYHAILRDYPLHLNSIREVLDFTTIRPDDDICRQLHAASSDLSMKPYDRASTWFLQGQIYMNAGRDDKAFAFFDEGNRQMRDVHNNQRLEYSFSRLLPQLDAAFQRRHAPVQAPEPCPLLLIAGLPRSGKTLMERLLASQPGLLGAGETSSIYNLFLDVDRSGGADATMAILRNLPGQPIRGHFAGRIKYGPKKQATRCVETTPGNLEQLGLLGPLHPDVPIVFVRRDPRDLAASLYFKQFNKAHRYTYDLACAARAIARTEYLARLWQNTMPNPMIEVTYEEMVADPVGVASRVLGHFGIPVDATALRQAAGDDGKALNLAPGRSLDGVGAIRSDLIGFSDRFERHLAAVGPAYELETRSLDAAHRL